MTFFMFLREKVLEGMIGCLRVCDYQVARTCLNLPV